MQTTFTKRMAQLQRPGKTEALRLLLAGDKSPLICLIAGADKRIAPAASAPLHGMMVISGGALSSEAALPF